MEVDPKIYVGLLLVPCIPCDTLVAEGSTCPQAVPCRTCFAEPGSLCKRPSGHQAMTLHKSRWVDAERLDTANLTAVAR